MPLKFERFLSLVIIMIIALILEIMGVILVGMVMVIVVEILMVLGVLIFGGLLAYRVSEPPLSRNSENYPLSMYKLLL